MKDRWGGTPLADAVREGHHSVTKLLVSHKAELQMAESESAGMLCDFTQKGDIDKTTQLLDAGCPVNAADYDGRTALHLACSEGLATGEPNRTFGSVAPHAHAVAALLTARVRSAVGAATCKSSPS